MTNKYTDIQQLLFDLNNRKESAFTWLHDELFKNLCDFANSLIDDADTAKDIVSVIFTTFYKRAQFNFYSLENIKAYFFVATRNNSLSFIDSRNKEREKKKTYLRAHPGPSYFTADKLVHADLKKIVKKALEELPLQCREICHLHFIEELTVKEVAEKLSISPSTVQTQKTIGLKKLRILLAPFRKW